MLIWVPIAAAWMVAADEGFYVQLGTAGEWVAGVGTLAAVFVALHQVRLERERSVAALEEQRANLERELEHQRELNERTLAHANEVLAEQRETYLLERLWRQAERVGCFAERSGYETDDVRAFGRQGPIIVSRNDSDAMIHNIQAFAVTSDGLVMSEKRGSRAPGEELAQRVPWPHALSSGERRLAGITFRDNAGKWWVRWLDGTLREWDRSEDVLAHPELAEIRAPYRRHSGWQT